MKRPALLTTFKNNRDYSLPTNFYMGFKKPGSPGIPRLTRSSHAVDELTNALSGKSMQYMPAAAISFPNLDYSDRVLLTRQLIGTVGKRLFKRKIPVKHVELLSPVPLKLHRETPEENLDLRGFVYKDGKTVLGGDLILKDDQTNTRSLVPLPKFNPPAVIFRDTKVLHGTSAMTYLVNGLWPIFKLKPVYSGTLAQESELVRTQVYTALSDRRIDPTRYLTSIWDNTNANVEIIQRSRY